jgi:arginase family enzyme/GNAT superfamily N-acetyltransferase
MRMTTYSFTPGDLTLVEVPQWQGSSRPTARRLREGAAELAAMIPAARRLKVEIATEAGVPRDSVNGLDILVQNLEATRAAVAQAEGRPTITIGGDCAVDLAPIEAALAKHGERLAVVWFDAHADLNTPASSPSGAFHGMILRTLLGDGPADLLPQHVLAPSQVVLAGARALDPDEQAFIDNSELQHLGVDELGNVIEAVTRTGATAVYVHIDLDVLDPQVFDSVGTPEPGGLDPTQLTAAVKALAAHFTLAGLAITEYEHDKPQPVLKEIVDELVPLFDNAWRIEQSATRAWPASIVEENNGWLLRATPGVTRRRSNSAARPPYISYQQVDTLEVVEAFYADRGLPVAIQVTPAEQHTALDALLETRGYRHESPTSVFSAPTEQVITATASYSTTIVDLSEEPTKSWLEAFDQLDEHADSMAVGELVISRISDPTAHASVTVDGQVAGLGLFVAGHGHAGVFCMAVRPGHRRQGIATAILNAGARWADTQGADRLYLQVTKANTEARKLYARAGFAESHSYHYRVRDLSTR